MKLGVLVSGKGSNLEALLTSEASGALRTETRVVISNVAGVRALEVAARADKKNLVLTNESFSSREAFETALVLQLREHGVEWVLLAGFNRLLTSTFLEAFPDRVVNIHPSLLPAFVGPLAIRQALRHGVRQTGVTLHLVDEGIDTGPILAQAPVPILDSDDESTLAARVHAVEHRLLVETLRRIVDKGFALSRTSDRPRVVWND